MGANYSFVVPFVGDCLTNTNISQTFQDNYFERDSLKHAMIGYLDYMSMTVRNQRWTRAKYLVLIDSLIE